MESIETRTIRQCVDAKAGREAVELAASELRSAWDDLSKSFER
jgi:hypothetical protein